MALFEVCPLSELSFEKPKKFQINDFELLVVKAHVDKVWAFQNLCPHQDKSLEKGTWNPQTAEITCPFHKAVFSVSKRGEVLAPPACTPLTVYKTIVQIKNEIEFVFVELN